MGLFMSKLAREIRMELKRQWTRVRQAGNLERERDLLDAKAGAERDILRINAAQAGVRHQYSSTQASWFAGRAEDDSQVPQVEHYHELASRATNVAGWCVTLLESLFAGALSFLWFDLSVYWAVGIGVAITLLIAVAAKGILSPLVIGRYADRPKAARDPLLMILIVVAPVTIVLLGIGFLVRGADFKWLDALFPWDMGALSIALPILAGALFALSDLFGWSTRQVDEYSQLDVSRNESVQLRDYCARELEGLPKASTQDAIKLRA